MILASCYVLLVFVFIWSSYEKGARQEVRLANTRAHTGGKDAANEHTKTQQTGTIFEFLALGTASAKKDKLSNLALSHFTHMQNGEWNINSSECVWP